MTAATEVEDGERQLDTTFAQGCRVVAQDRVLPRVLDSRSAGVDAQLLDPARHAAALLDQLDQLGVEGVDAHSAVVNGRDVGGDDVAHRWLRVGLAGAGATKKPRVTRGGRWKQLSAACTRTRPGSRQNMPAQRSLRTVCYTHPPVVSRTSD